MCKSHRELIILNNWLAYNFQFKDKKGFSIYKLAMFFVIFYVCDICCGDIMQNV